MTRNIKNTFFEKTQANIYSKFVNELIEEYPTNFEIYKINNKKLKCPKCGGGNITVRKGAYGVFWGCSNYPLCDYARNILFSLKRFRKRVATGNKVTYDKILTDIQLNEIVCNIPTDTQELEDVLKDKIKVERHGYGIIKLIKKE